MTLNLLLSECRFLYLTSGEDESPTESSELTVLSELTEDSDVIITGMYEWRLEWYAYELREAHNFFMTVGEDCTKCTEQLNAYVPEQGRDVYLIVEDGVYEPEDEEEGATRKFYGVNNNIDLVYTSKGVIREEDYLDYLKQDVDWIEDVELLGERDSFCGLLNIYKVHVKE